jgi:predicted restriction endonuclease
MPRPERKSKKTRTVTTTIDWKRWRKKKLEGRKSLTETRRGYHHNQRRFIEFLYLKYQSKKNKKAFSQYHLLDESLVEELNAVMPGKRLLVAVS